MGKWLASTEERPKQLLKNDFTFGKINFSFTGNNSFVICFGYDLRQRDNFNFRETIKNINQSVSLWRWRGPSLLRRIQIVKTFAILKFLFRASVTPTTNKELIKEVNSILYRFIWDGKDKVKRHAGH